MWQKCGFFLDPFKAYQSLQDHWMLKFNSAVYANDITLLANTPTQAACGIVLHVNADKIKYMCFNQTDDITLKGGPLKLVDNFTYL